MRLVFRGIEELPESHGTRIVHLSDLHLARGRKPDEFLVFEALLDVLEDVSPDVLVISGDLAHIPDDAVTLTWVKEKLDALGMPVVVVPGNHDIADPDRPEAFMEHFGLYPRYETYSGVGFALFDSFCGLPLDQRGAWERELFKEAGHLSMGAITTEQFEFFAAKVETPWIAVIHHHLFEESKTNGSRALRPLIGAESYLSWCESFGCRAILHGHQHAYSPVNVVGPTPIFRGGATTKLPAVFRVLDVDESVEWHEIEIRVG